MNLFYLDTDLDKCAEQHVDDHVGKMQLEVAQMQCTNLWIDSLFGYVPRPLTKEEHTILKTESSKWRSHEQSERPFPYLPCHHNHPSTIWLRESLENHFWGCAYASALNSEQHYRTGGQHKSMGVINALPLPVHMLDIGPTLFKLAMTDKMPPELVDPQNPIWSYRNFYMLDKATMASWTGRDKPYWWDDSLANYEVRISQT